MALSAKTFKFFHCLIIQNSQVKVGSGEFFKVPLPPKSPFCLPHPPSGTGCRGASHAVRRADASGDAVHVEEAALPAPHFGHAPVGPDVGDFAVEASERQQTCQWLVAVSVS